MSPGSIKLTTLTNFITSVSFFSPFKHHNTSGFQELQKETSCMEWANPLTQSCQERNMTRLTSVAKIHLIFGVANYVINEF